MNMPIVDTDSAVNHLQKGEVIAYPTEAIYGFGCDPWNPDAVQKLLDIKRRSIEKGFILVADDFDKVEHLVEPISNEQLSQAFASWPGHVTWLFPAKHSSPLWLRGNHSTIAIRISAHPDIQRLCHQFNSPLISTSANRENHPPSKDTNAIQQEFQGEITCILEGKIGDKVSPSEIKDIITGKIFRE